MRRQTLCIFSLAVLLASCEGIVQGNGKIISANNQLPLDSVKISWFSKVVYSDKDGNFSFQEFVGCVPACPDLELVLTKQGYETKYINLTKENNKHKSVFELIPSDNKIGDLSHHKAKSLLYYLSIITAIISLITLIILAGIKLKNKAAWFVIIVFGTATVYYNYLAKVADVKVFRPSLFVFTKYTFEPTWYQLNVPVGLIIFWTYYFYQLKKRDRS